MDRNSMSWVRTFTIYSASGAQIEHIDHYNLLVNLLHKATSPHGYSESIGQMIDNGLPCCPPLRYGQQAAALLPSAAALRAACTP